MVAPSTKPQRNPDLNKALRGGGVAATFSSMSHRSLILYAGACLLLVFLSGGYHATFFQTKLGQLNNEYTLTPTWTSCRSANVTESSVFLGASSQPEDKSLRKSAGTPLVERGTNSKLLKSVQSEAMPLTKEYAVDPSRNYKASVNVTQKSHHSHWDAKNASKYTTALARKRVQNSKRLTSGPYSRERAKKPKVHGDSRLALRSKTLRNTRLITAYRRSRNEFRNKSLPSRGYRHSRTEFRNKRLSNRAANNGPVRKPISPLETMVGPEGPLGCKVLEEYQYYVESEERLPNNLVNYIIVDRRHSVHVLRLGVPNCGYFYFKLSCRPPPTYFWGVQEWPEVVGHKLDKALGYNLTYPTIGFVLPSNAIATGRPSVTLPKCQFDYKGKTVLMGALMRFENFSVSKSWYRIKCLTKSIPFMEDIFKLNTLDYCLLNTDRHMAKNWFRGNNKVVAVDNGAWSFHFQENMCDKNEYLRRMFHPIETFRSKIGKSSCPVLERAETPVCELVKLLRYTDTVNTFFRSPKEWRKKFENELVNDEWFKVMPGIMQEWRLTGFEAISKILSRKFGNCTSAIKVAGIAEESNVQTQHVVKFISNEISERFTLAQNAVFECLKEK